MLDGWYLACWGWYLAWWGWCLAWRGWCLHPYMRWHVRVLEHNARRVIRTQVQREWVRVVELERLARDTGGKMGILLGWGRAGRGAIHKRAMWVPMMETAASREKRGQLPTQSWWGEGEPPG